MSKHPYAKLTVEGDKKTKWICGCYLTEDDFFKFCAKHNETLKKTVLSQIDELDMILVIKEQDS